MTPTYLLSHVNTTRVLNRKSTVLSLYPELSRLYSNTQGCLNCKKKSKGRAILLHILNDPDLKSKNRKALAQILPVSFVNNLGD